MPSSHFAVTNSEERAGLGARDHLIDDITERSRCSAAFRRSVSRSAQRNDDLARLILRVLFIVENNGQWVSVQGAVSVKAKGAAFCLLSPGGFFCLLLSAYCFLKLAARWPIQRLVSGMRRTVGQVLRLMREREEFKVNPMLAAYPWEAALRVMCTPPPVVVALNAVLGTSPIDLRQLGSVGRSHPGAATQILRLCNSSIFRLSRPVASLEQAVVSLGAEVLRTLGLAWGLVELVGKYLPPVQAQAFWQHGLTLALLSERIAERMDYPVAEGYLAGLLHDVGRIPLWMATPPERRCYTGDSRSAGDCPEIEVQDFGVDHCELGRRIGIAWSFSDPFVEVFSRHHRSDETAEENELVRIVSAAERFCLRPAAAGSEGLSHRTHPVQSARNRRLPNARVPDLEMAESMSLAEVLEFEFLQAAQQLRLGASNRFSPALRG